MIRLATLLLLTAVSLGAAEIAAESGYYFRFTPDSGALVHTLPGNSGLRIHELSAGTSADLSGGLPEGQEVNGPFWTVTADSSRILLASSPDDVNYDVERQHLYLVNRDGSGFTRIGEGVQHVVPLLSHPQPADASHAIFRQAGPERSTTLFAHHFAGGERVRLSDPQHPKAKVVYWMRSPATGRIAYVADDLEEGRFRLFAVDPDGTNRMELTAEMPRDFQVPEDLIGRSDRDHDKAPVKFTADGRHVVFSAMDPATGTGIYDTKHLFAVDAHGGPIADLVRPGQGWGVGEYWTGAGSDVVFVRSFDPTANHYVVDLTTLESKRLHPRTVGWQSTSWIMPAADTGRVWFWGDVETQDVHSFLYWTDYRGGELRKYRFELPYDDRTSLHPVMTEDEQTIVFRTITGWRDTWELFAVWADGSTQKFLSRRSGRDEVEAFELIPGRRALVFIEGAHVFYRDLDGDENIRLTGDLADGEKAVRAELSPDGERVAWIQRREGSPSSLHVAELP